MMGKKNADELFAIGDTVFWWGKSPNGKVFYKGKVEGHLEPKEKAAAHLESNLMRYLIKVEYQVSTVKGKLTCSFRDPTAPNGGFYRRPRRSLVNDRYFPTEEAMAEDVRAVYRVDLSTLINEAGVDGSDDSNEVYLIDSETDTEMKFGSLKAIGKYLKIEERRLLYIAKTLWISPRYQIRYVDPFRHQPTGFKLIATDQIFKTILDGWQAGLYTNPNAFYRAAAAAAMTQSHEFEFESRRYHLVDKKGQPLISELLPDIKINDPEPVKIAKIREKARELNERPGYTISPWAIALNVQSHCPHLLPCLNERNPIVDYLYKHPYGDD